MRFKCRLFFYGELLKFWVLSKYFSRFTNQYAIIFRTNIDTKFVKRFELNLKLSTGVIWYVNLAY